MEILAIPEQKQIPGQYSVDAVISMDWFECMIEGKLVEFGSPLEMYEYDNKRILIQQVTSGAAARGTQFFKHKFEIYIDGKKFAYCLCETRNVNLIPKDFISLKLYNNILYELRPMERLNYLLEKMNWTFQNLTRLDIAVDGFGYIDVFRKWQQGTYLKVGSCRSAQAHYGGAGLGLTGFDWGGGLRGKKWNKRITCYNKSDKLTHEHKNYIGDFWKKSKLKREITCLLNGKLATEDKEMFGKDGLQKVERLELKLRNEEIKKIGNEIDVVNRYGEILFDKDSVEYKKELKKNPVADWQGVDWKRLDDFQYLAGIMKVSMKNYFEFVSAEDAEKQKNISRVKRVKIVDWEKLGAEKLERCTTEVSSRIWSGQISVKDLFFNYLSTNRDNYLIIAQEKALNLNCMKWFMEMQSKWRKQYDYLLKYFPEKFEHYSRYKTTEEGEQLKLIEVLPVHNPC